MRHREKSASQTRLQTTANHSTVERRHTKCHHHQHCSQHHHHLHHRSLPAASMSSNTATSASSGSLRKNRLARVTRHYEWESATAGTPISVKNGEIIEIIRQYNNDWCCAAKHVPCDRVNFNNCSNSTTRKSDSGFFIPTASIQLLHSDNDDADGDDEEDEEEANVNFDQTNKSDTSYHRNSTHSQRGSKILRAQDGDEACEEDLQPSDEAIGSSRDSLIEEDSSENIPESNSSHSKLEPIYSAPSHTLPKVPPRNRAKNIPDYENLSSFYPRKSSETISPSEQTDVICVHLKTLQDGWAEYRSNQDGRIFYWNSTTGERSLKPPRRTSIQSAEEVNAATLPLKKSTTSLLSRLPSQRKFPMVSQSDLQRSSSRSSKLKNVTTFSRQQSDSFENDKNTLIVSMPAPTASSSSASTTTPMTSLTSSWHATTHNHSAHQTHRSAPAPPRLPQLPSTPNNKQRFHQPTVPSILLFNGHAESSDPQQQQHHQRQLSIRARQQQQQHHQQQRHHAPQLPVATGSYATFDSLHPVQQRKTGFFRPSGAETLSRTNRPQSMMPIGNSVDGIQRIESFKHRNPFASAQSYGYTSPPKSVTKADAIYHGPLTILQHITSPSQHIEKTSKKGKKPKGVERYAVLTKSNFLLFFKNEKSAFSAGKIEDSFSLLGATIQWEMNSRIRFDITIIPQKILLQHSKPEEAERWYKEINHLLSVLPKFDDLQISGFSRVGSYRPQTSRDSSQGTQTPPSERKILKIRERLKQFLRLRPPVETLKEKGIFRDELIFGRNLEELCSRDHSFVPKFVRDCVQAIESRDMEAEGLYRACGNLSNVQKLRFDINQEKYDALFAEDDVHVLTGLLKMFFRNMPDPLFPSTNFNSLIAVVTCKDSESEKIRRFRSLVTTFPQPNYETIRFMLSHLLKVICFSRENRMNIQNLAIVFGPTLLRPEDDSNNLLVDMSLQINQCRIVEFLLQNFNAIFGSPGSVADTHL